MLICYVFCSILSLLEKRNTVIFSFLLRYIYVVLISLDLVESFCNLFTLPFSEHFCVRLAIHVYFFGILLFGSCLFKNLLSVRVNNQDTGVVYFRECLMFACLQSAKILDKMSRSFILSLITPMIYSSSTFCD